MLFTIGVAFAPNGQAFLPDFISVSVGSPTRSMITEVVSQKEPVPESAAFNPQRTTNNLLIINQDIKVEKILYSNCTWKKNMRMMLWLLPYILPKCISE